MQHRGTQTLETERLNLRRFSMEDAEAMWANWAREPEVTKYLTWPPHPSPEVTRQLLSQWIGEYERPEYYNWVLELKQTGEIIGNLSVVRMNESIDEAELGYCMGSRWWGMELMPEAAEEVVRFLLLEAGFNRVVACHDVENPKSGRVMQKIGMRREGMRRQAGRNNRGIIDDVTYAILRSDLT